MKKMILLIGLALMLAACQPAPQLSAPDMTATVVALTPTATNTPLPPTPTPLAPGEDLAASIERAAGGDTLYLASGVYQVHDAIILKKALTLVGAGRDETKIVFDTAVKVEGNTLAVLHVQSPGALTLKQVALVYEGKDPAGVIRASDAGLEFSGCRIEGVVSDSDLVNSGVMMTASTGGRIDDCIFSGDKRSAGIYITGSGKTEITNSQFDGMEIAIATGADSTAALTVTGNKMAGAKKSGYGLYLRGAPKVTLLKNTIEGGTHSVAISEQSSVQASENEISGCSKIGFYVSSSAPVTLENNRITGCTTIGIGFYESAAPVVKGNTLQLKQKDPDTGMYTGIGINITKNAGGQVLDNTIEGFQLGILALDDTKPVLEGNTLTDNDISIDFDGNSVGAARKNKIADSQVGISLEAQAKPVLEENTITAREKYNPYFGDSTGIRYTQNTGGTAAKNVITGFGAGIELNEESAPVLKENAIDGGTCGIRYKGNSAGSAVGNKISGNDEDGIYLEDQSAPLLQGNEISSNAMSGINVYGESRPVIEGNEIYSCKYGILVWDLSSPDVRKNNVHDNKSKDMQTGKSAK